MTVSIIDKPKHYKSPQIVGSVLWLGLGFRVMVSYHGLNAVFRHGRVSVRDRVRIRLGLPDSMVRFSISNRV